MHRIAWIFGTVGILVLVLTEIGWAQVAVFDSQNYIMNTTQVVRMLDELANQAQDLAALTDLSGYGEQISAAQALLSVVQQLAQRMLGRYAKWARVIPTGSQIPCTVDSLLSWNSAYDAETQAALQDSFQAQTLISQSNVALQVLIKFVQQAISVAGSVRGLQALNGILGNVVNEIVRLETGSNSFHEVLLRGHAKEVVNNMADPLIEQTALAGITGQPPPSCPTSW